MSTETNDYQSDPWLRVFCPEKTCLTEEEKLTEPPLEPTHVDRRGVWLGIFCPDNQCEAETPTNVV